MARTATVEKGPSPEPARMIIDVGAFNVIEPGKTRAIPVS